MFEEYEEMVKCPYCGEAMFANWSSYVTDSNVVDDERGMGFEVEHIIECDEYNCTNLECKKKFRVSGYMCEYPVGICEYIEIRAKKLD